jgi:hypothetical protein
MRDERASDDFKLRVERGRVPDPWAWMPAVGNARLRPFGLLLRLGYGGQDGAALFAV